MVVSEGAINNIMGGMENTAGVRLHSHRHKLKQRFDIIRKLGQGTYGKVQLAINKETGQEVAIKTIKKAKIETEQDLIRIRREIQIMSSVQHPQIIHIYEVFENREKMVLVMEYAAGGELYDYLSDRKVLSEGEARRVFRQVSSAVYYCHKHKICHRDLKLENILLDLDGNAKIADFGLSNVFDEKHRLDTFCGSPLYASPEIVKGIPYLGPEVDCWSLGVLLYTLVYGAMPFDGSNFRRLVKQITQGDFYEPSNPSSASELIRHMLTVTSSERANVEDICNHWWVNEGYSVSCLSEAEALANQTPVRLDLLLSLAPKHIDSEHMLIQPEDEDISQRDIPMPAEPQDNLTENGPSQTPAARSQSAGALPPGNKMDIETLLEKKRLERKMNEDKKRHAVDEPPATTEKKKKKESSSGSRKEEEKRKSVRKKEVIDDVEMSDKSEKKKSVRKKDVDRENTFIEPSEKAEKKKVVKKRDSSLTRENKGEKEKKKTVKKKEPNKEEQIVDSLKPASPNSTSQHSSAGESSNMDSLSGDVIPSASRRVDPPHPEPSRLTPSPTPSTDATIKASDSSIYSRISKSPSKICEVETPTTPKVAQLSLPPKTEVSVEEKISTAPEKPKIKQEAEDLDTEKILQETAAKIQRVEAAMAAQSKQAKEIETPKSPPVREVDEPKSPPSRDSLTNKSSSRSSRGPTPGRSRTGSESSTETRPTRSEASSRRQSKIFSKAALFDNMASSISPPPAPERPKKVSRPGGLNMSDLAKKFEEKPSAAPTEKKTTSRVITPLKVSDARKAFEGKAESSQPGTPLRKGSLSSGGGESLPTSPTRTSRSGSISSGTSGSTPTSKSGSQSTSKAESKEISTEDYSKTSLVSPNMVMEKERESSPKKVLKSLSKDQAKKEKTPPISSYGAKKDKSPLAEAKKEKTPIKDKENVQPSSVKNVPSVTDTTSKKLDRRTPSIDKPITKPSTKIANSNPPRSKVESGSVFEASIKSPEISNVPEEARTRQIPIRIDSSESSDSESEAERLLRLLAAKREKVEIAKAEKLKKVSGENKEPLRIDMPAIKEESRTPTPARHMASTPTSEASSDMKFATLPRGFKSKTPVDSPSLVKTSKEIEVKPPLVNKKGQAVRKVVAIPPEQVLSPTPRSNSDLSRLSRTSSGDESRPSSENPRKKTEMEIVLTHKPRATPPLGGDASNRSSYAEIRIASPPAKEPPQSADPKSEAQRTVGASTDRRFSAGGEPQLQRARRERIIPIMLEDDDEDDRSSCISDARTTSSSMSSTSVRSGVRPQSPPVQARAQTNRKASPESIQKSRRERIIPIAVEGEGLVTPSIDDVSSEGGRHAQPASFQKAQGATAFNRGRGFFVDRSESFSSAGEEEEEEDDGFQILTAESLFSTLLSRVRSLTRKMATDDPRAERLRSRMSPGMLGGDMGPFAPMGTGPPGVGTTGPNSGFWSSLYTKDSPGRRISVDTMGNPTQARDDDPFGHFGPPLWNRSSISRDPSDADSVFSEPSFSTLPRGSLFRNSLLPPPRLLRDPFFDFART